MQSVLVWGFARALKKFAVPLVADDAAARAVVTLCLRGTDPFLKNCLQGLLRQDYPHYQVRIIIDSPEDPAHEIVREILAQTNPGNVFVENLLEKSATCSLKCSSLRQVIASLKEDVEVVAQLDADTTPHSTWLRELVTALQPKDVGAATGNRWYMPQTPSVGALVRYAWNAAAIVQMYWYRIAWGGTLAIKTRVFRESDLLDKWGLAFCEDTMLHEQFKKLGLRVAFVPNLMMINRENTSLGGFFSWVSRQLMTAKLYHPAWPAVVLHGIVSTVAPLGSILLLVIAIIRGQTNSVIILSASLALFVASLLLAIQVMAKRVRQIVEHRGEPANWVTPEVMLKCALFMPLTQFVYPVALTVAAFAKSTTWRGIHYKIDGPWQIRMQKYVPFGSTTNRDAEESL